MIVPASGWLVIEKLPFNNSALFLILRKPDVGDVFSVFLQARISKPDSVINYSYINVFMIIVHMQLNAFCLRMLKNIIKRFLDNPENK